MSLSPYSSFPPLFLSPLTYVSLSPYLLLTLPLTARLSQETWRERGGYCDPKISPSPKNLRLDIQEMRSPQRPHWSKTAADLHLQLLSTSNLRFMRLKVFWLHEQLLYDFTEGLYTAAAPHLAFSKKKKNLWMKSKLKYDNYLTLSCDCG